MENNTLEQKGDPQDFRFEMQAVNFNDPTNTTKVRGMLSASGKQRTITNAEGKHEFQIKV